MTLGLGTEARWSFWKLFVCELRCAQAFNAGGNGCSREVCHEMGRLLGLPEAARGKCRSRCVLCESATEEMGRAPALPL